MKPQLALCSLALNPQAPSPTATMVKVQDGEMVAFGGTFCVRVPFAADIGACFNPQAAAVFFRKDRKGVSYTLNKGKLVMQEGKEKLSIPYLEPDEMVTIDVLGKPQPVESDLKHLRDCLAVVNPAHARVACQGVMFRYGMMEATNGRVLVSALSDLPEELEFNLPHDAAKALAHFKAKLVGIVQDNRSVKFCFDDGSSLTSLTIVEHLITTAHFFEGEWSSLELKNADDILKLSCEYVEFLGGELHYLSENVVGSISGTCRKIVDIKTRKDTFDGLLKISPNIHITSNEDRFMAMGETCRAICLAMAKTPKSK